MRGIRKSFDGTQALKGVDFSARQGEVHAIVGENGAGKSTLMKILAGALRRDAGEIILDGAARRRFSSPFSAHRLGIRAVYQEFSLVRHLSITENILLGQMPTGTREMACGLEEGPSAGRRKTGRDRVYRAWTCARLVSQLERLPSADGRDRQGGRHQAADLDPGRTFGRAFPGGAEAPVRLDERLKRNRR